MTPEEISARLEKIETTLEENADALSEANKVRDEVAKLRKSNSELESQLKLALRLIGDSFNMCADTTAIRKVPRLSEMYDEFAKTYSELHARFPH